MNGIPYVGWECTTCKKGNNLTRHRCRVCGRKKAGGEPQKTFLRRPHTRWKQRGKKTVKETR